MRSSWRLARTRTTWLVVAWSGLGYEVGDDAVGKGVEGVDLLVGEQVDHVAANQLAFTSAPDWGLARATA